MISDDRLQAAMVYRAETDLTCAELETEVARQEFKIKQIKAQVFLHSEGTVDARKAEAELSEATLDAEENYLQAMQDFKAMKYKRETENQVIELWRSLNANRRQGNI